jgi:polygalacturonase
MNNTCQTPFGLVTLGSEESGGIKNVYAYNMTTHGSGARNMIDVRANKARGGGGTNINFDTVMNAHIGGPLILLETSYNAGGCNTQVGNVTPIFDNFNFSHLTINGGSAVLGGSGEASNPTHMTISDSVFTGVGGAGAIANATITWTNTTVNGVMQH